ncbi:ribosome small subunit-dependent GTPase A [bacterium]|nr:ribosome small subunit-dependent GTPase A [bacterium]
MHPHQLGWDPSFEKQFEPFRGRGLFPLRIVREDRRQYLAMGEGREWICSVSGKFRHEAGGKGDLPAVGDWVAASTLPAEGKAVIRSLVPRKSVFRRKAAGGHTVEQVVAANMDFVFIISGLDRDFNPRRIERYLSLAWESGALPVVLLNKADLCAETESRKIEVESIAPGVDVHAVSAAQKTGLEVLDRYIQEGKTAVFLGSSGVGKSTLINSLLGYERLKVNEVRGWKDRGRHTTTYRELVLLPGGGMVIDTPGMRELAVWGDEEGLKQAFEDIEELAGSCRFRDCAHESEPGCAVQEAVQNGLLEPDRLAGFLKLKKEFKYLSDRQTMKPSAIEKARWKNIAKMVKKINKSGE